MQEHFLPKMSTSMCRVPFCPLDLLFLSTVVKSKDMPNDIVGEIIASANYDMWMKITASSIKYDLSWFSDKLYLRSCFNRINVTLSPN